MMTLKQKIKSSPFLARPAWFLYREVLLQRSRHPAKGRVPVFSEETRLTFSRLRTYEDFQQFSQDRVEELHDQERVESDLSPLQHKSFSISGTCALCGCDTTFKTNFDYSIRSSDGRSIPNFREHLFCVRCGLKNRLRAALQLFIQEFHPLSTQPIYITEQFGAAYRWLKGRGYAISGSEYIPGSGPFGSSPRGIRNEDLGALTWPSEMFDFVLSFDVLEHVPSVDACFSEIFRCLRPQGKLLFTAPFSPNLSKTLIRAVMQSDGSISHLMEPEYHGGNMIDAAKGTLCFRYFAWDVLPQLKEIGFSDAEAWLFWSRKLGYLGGTQIVIVAQKG